MSTCISVHGEYSEHTLDDAHTCTLCGVLDEDALRAELRDLRARLAAVSAAAPDEREAVERWWESLVQAECGAGHVIFIDDGDGTVYACPACALAEARAALAARPAPTVSGEALERVRAAIAADEAEWRREWRAWCRKSERDPGAAGPSPERMTNLRRARVALAALGLTVADEGRADA